MTAAVEEPVLPVDDVQGDVLAGFRKGNQTFLFLRTVDPAAAKGALRDLAPQVSSLRDVAAFNAAYRQARSTAGAVAALTANWVNIGFTAAGLARLTGLGQVGRFADRSFRLGLLRRSAFLGDPVAPETAGHPGRWHFGGPSSPVDAVLLVAGDDPGSMAATVAGCIAVLSQGYEVVWREQCGALPGGREHFGFRDGVSQPAVRGLLDDGTPLAPREVDPADPAAALYARRGQPLVWPGQFVLGLPRQRASATDPTPLPPAPVFPDWARHGSMLVVRRLRQDLEGLQRFVTEAATELAGRPGFAGMTPQRLATLLVGRWPSGAPLARSPASENEALGAAHGPANAFGYLNATPPLPTRDGVPPDPFPAALPDPGGVWCPHGAHIRKMNPRDQPPAASTAGDSLTRLVLRRGIAFDHTTDGGPLDDRGLMFACYQSSLRQGFEFLSTLWANSAARPHANPGGMDLLVGQLRTQSGERRRSMTLVGSGGERAEVVTAADWVVPTGGGYFFVPSIPALRDVLAR